MATKKTQQATIYPNHINWDDFDNDDLEQIDNGVSLLKDFVLHRKTKPEVSYIKTMFLDEFEGFEDVSPEVAVAITEKLLDMWEDENAEEASTNKKSHADKFADHTAISLGVHCSEEIVEQVKEHARILSKHMGRDDYGNYVLVDNPPQEAYDELFELDKLKSIALVDVFAESALKNEGDDMMGIVNDLLLSYIFNFKNVSFFEQVADKVTAALHEEDGIGTPIYSTIKAMNKVFEDKGIEQFDVSYYPMDFVPNLPIGATITASWIEDGQFKTKTAYGHFKKFIEANDDN